MVNKNNEKNLLKMYSGLLVTGAILLGIGLMMIASAVTNKVVYETTPTQDLSVYNAFKASNSAMRKSFEDSKDIITKEDVDMAMQGVAEGVQFTMDLASDITGEMVKDGITDAAKSISEMAAGQELPSIEASADDPNYAWLFDYNNDGVKDIYDYNLWKQYNGLNP